MATWLENNKPVIPNCVSTLYVPRGLKLTALFVFLLFLATTNRETLSGFYGKKVIYR